MWVVDKDGKVGGGVRRKCGGGELWVPQAPSKTRGTEVTRAQSTRERWFLARPRDHGVQSTGVPTDAMSCQRTMLLCAVRCAELENRSGQRRGRSPGL